MRDIVVIPDTQASPGTPYSHIKAASNYMLEHKPDILVHLGDHWDMPSLSPYDVKKPVHASEEDILKDISAGRRALAPISQKLDNHNRNRIRSKKKQYKPKRYFLVGNHEMRLDWHRRANKKTVLGVDSLPIRDLGWHPIPYLMPMKLSGIIFSHYFVNPDSAKRGSFIGTIHAQLTTLGHSFVQGHRPGLFVAGPRVTPDNRVARGIIAGSFYEHEDFNGPQGQPHWHGILHLRDCYNGNFRLEEIPLEYLKRTYL